MYLCVSELMDTVYVCASVWRYGRKVVCRIHVCLFVDVYGRCRVCLYEPVCSQTWREDGAVAAMETVWGKGVGMEGRSSAGTLGILRSPHSVTGTGCG